MHGAYRGLSSRPPGASWDMSLKKRGWLGIRSVRGPWGPTVMLRRSWLHLCCPHGACKTHPVLFTGFQKHVHVSIEKYYEYSSCVKSCLFADSLQQQENASRDTCPPAHYRLITSSWILSPLAVNELKKYIWVLFFFILILLIGSVALPAPLHSRLAINEKVLFPPFFPQNLHLLCGLITAGWRQCGKCD